MEEEFRMHRGRWPGRRRGWHYPRRRWLGSRLPGWPVTVVSKPVYVAQSDSYNDCLYASGKCPDQFKDQYGQNFLNNPKQMCRNSSVQVFTQNLPEHCLPNKEPYQHNRPYFSPVGIL